MTNHSTMHLGKRPRRHDARTLRMAGYITSELPAAPNAVDYTRGVSDWGMMLNDQLGDCTIADGPGHATQVWTLNALGTMVTPPDSEVLDAYKKWCGYDPADPGSDRGGVELDVLKHWRKEGFGGHTLHAYVSIGLREDRTMGRSEDLLIPPIATAIWLFGGAYIGVELPLSAQDQEVWDVPQTPGRHDEPGSWGGHALYLVGYDLGSAGVGMASSALGNGEVGFPARVSGANSNGGAAQSEIGNLKSTITCITWGGLKKMTWAWFEKYCSEAYALVSRDWLDANGVSPSGFDLAALEADLAAVSNQPSAISGQPPRLLESRSALADR